jgi:hypothetical protein
MELIVVGSAFLCALVGTVVGLKLLGLAARSRKFPEFAIGAGLFAYAVAQPLLLARTALGNEVSVGLGMAIAASAYLAIFATLVCVSLFTWQVFGAESRWRQALVAGFVTTGLLLTALTVRAAWLRLTVDAPPDVYGRVGITLPFALSFGWMALESLGYYTRMRRRQALGLADPVVTNRFLVWGAGEGMSALLLLTLSLMAAIRQETLIADPFFLLLPTLAGLVNALVWWLSFMPPAAYLGGGRGNVADDVADA